MSAQDSSNPAPEEMAYRSFFFRVSLRLQVHKSSTLMASHSRNHSAPHAPACTKLSGAGTHAVLKSLSETHSRALRQPQLSLQP